MTKHTIPPLTHATVRVTAQNGAERVNDAVVTADVFGPSGRLIASNVALSNTGVNGVYYLSILPAWSADADGRAVLGPYAAEVKAIAPVTGSEVQRVERYTWICNW